MTVCDRGGGSNIIKNSLTYFMDGPKPIGLKKEYIDQCIDSTAQKKTNKIAKFLINAFSWNVASTLIKMHFTSIRIRVYRV